MSYNPAVMAIWPRRTDKTSKKRACLCPDCAKEGIEVYFFSRKARHQHQMTVHRKLSSEGTQRTKDKNRRRRAKNVRLIAIDSVD